MTQSCNLYRRPSGIYVLRIVVPARYRQHIGQRELHISTRTNDRTSAKVMAHTLLSHWQLSLRELGQEKGMSLHGKLGDGLISVAELSESSGVTISLILRELLNQNIPIAYAARDADGYIVSDIGEIDREPNGGFVLNSVFENGTPHTFTRYLKPYNKSSVILGVIENGFSEEVVFRIPERRDYAFFDFPGLRLEAKSILLSKLQGQRIIQALLGLSGVVTKPEHALAIPKSVGMANKCCHAEYAERRVSWLLGFYIQRKAEAWKQDQQKRIKTICGTFVELMDDPCIGMLDREMIWAYEKRLRLMPANRYLAARRHGTNQAEELIALADEHGEERLSDVSVESYLDKLSGMFYWAKKNMILTYNPAEGVIEKRKGSERAQDKRSKFSDQDLSLIFSADWFSNGTGKRNAQGRFYQYRPHYYWLPLIGLYSGARINEICQLYIKDVVRSGSGVYYFDFNQEGVNGKKASDKSFKTDESQRIVSIHPRLIELGLTKYIEALGAAGYERLFPELKYDSVKGYGKPAGSWFNERFLGVQLGFKRDGMKSFHSFRHTFITAMFELEIPSDVISQLAGHSRGQTTTLQTYRKDAEAARLYKYLESLEFNLPPIMPFCIKDGLDAVRDAVNRKSK